MDQALLEFAPIAFLRVIYVSHGKGGKLPRANLRNMEIKKTAPTRIEILAKDETALPHDQEDLGNGQIRFALRASGGTFDPVLVARAYFKIALGTVAYDRGGDFALAERYDAARAFIQGGQGFSNPLILKTSGEPHGRISVEWRKLEPGTFFCIDIFGVVAAFNLEVGPSMQLPDNLDSLGLAVFDLRKPDAAA